MDTLWQSIAASNDWVIICIDIVIILILSWILSHIAKNIILRRCKENTAFALRIKNIVIYTIAGIGILSQFHAFNSIMSTLLASGGIVAIVLGLAAQETMGNFISGMMITAFKPFKIGDTIRLNNGEYMGTIADISIRHTVILTFENTRIVIPNSVINSATLENLSVDTFKTNFLNTYISYESDLKKAMSIIEEEVQKHKDYMTPTKEPQPVITRLLDFEDSGLHLKTTVYSKDFPTGVAMLSDLRISIKKRFDAEGIDIPYPHCVIIQKKTDDPHS